MNGTAVQHNRMWVTGHNRVQCGMAVLRGTGAHRGEAAHVLVGLGEQNGPPAARWGGGEERWRSLAGAEGGRQGGQKRFLRDLVWFWLFFDAIGRVQGGKCWSSAGAKQQRGAEPQLVGREGRQTHEGCRHSFEWDRTQRRKSLVAETEVQKAARGAKRQRPQWPVAAIPGEDPAGARQQRGRHTWAEASERRTVQQAMDACAGGREKHGRRGRVQLRARHGRRQVADTGHKRGGGALHQMRSKCRGHEGTGGRHAGLRKGDVGNRAA